MNPPPPKDPREKETPPTTTSLMNIPTSGFSAVLGGLAVLPILFLIVFHAGAAYLSYQKYQSGLWAFLDFIFAYFYYPYYAFFLANEPSPVNTLIGGLKKMSKRR